VFLSDREVVFFFAARLQAWPTAIS